MTACLSCGFAMSSTCRTRRYREVGLPYVTLVNVEIRWCRRCRTRELVTPSIETLHRLIARAIVAQPAVLTTDAIRFLRTWLDLSRDDLALAIGVRRETAFRWERRDGPCRMTRRADRLLRLLVANHDPIEQFPVQLLTAEPEDAPRRITLSAPYWERTT